MNLLIVILLAAAALLIYYGITGKKPQDVIATALKMK